MGRPAGKLLLRLGPGLKRLEPNGLDAAASMIFEMSRFTGL